ncbi:MAG TPA: response regulator [Thermoanaerobaculia bacterium]|nr:response regulator [Thermoanaerobaculia bacterium]
MSLATAVALSSIPIVAAAPPPTVLIVEDERKLRGWLLDQFFTLGIVPLTAASGFEAIRVTGEQRPGLILLDGLLPEMHGFEIARFVRRIDSGYRPYIAIMTAIYKNVRYQNEARLKYGIDDYLIKPVQPASLAALVERARERA